MKRGLLATVLALGTSTAALAPCTIALAETPLPTLPRSATETANQQTLQSQGQPPGASTAPSTQTSASALDGIGQAPIPNGDRVRGRDRALDEAFHQILDRAAALIFDGPAIAERAVTLRLKIYPHARSYITSYRVLEENDQGSDFRVHVSAEVALSRLEHDLGSANAAASLSSSKSAAALATPRAVTCLFERDESGWVPAQDALVERVSNVFRGHGVETKPGAGPCVAPSAGPGGDAILDDGQAKNAARAARAQGAQGALLGVVKEVAIHGPSIIRGTALVAARAKASLLLVEAGGHVAAQADAEQDGYGKDPALARASATEAAANAALASLDDAIVARWPTHPAVQGPPTLALHADAIERYADLQSLQKALAAVAGVSAVEPRRFAGASVDLAVRTTLSPASLSSALARAPGGARYSLEPQADGTVNVRIAPVELAPVAPANSSPNTSSPAPMSSQPWSPPSPPSAGAPR